MEKRRSRLRLPALTAGHTAQILLGCRAFKKAYCPRKSRLGTYQGYGY